MQRFVVTAHFKSMTQARSAIEDLVAGDISTHAIGFVHTDALSGPSFKIVESTKAAQAYMGGVLIGAVVGALWFSLRYVGVISESEVDLEVSSYAGNWVSALVGASVGGFIGGVIGYFAGRRVPVHVAELQDEEERTSDMSKEALLAVTVDVSQTEWVGEVLARHGGTDVRQLDKKYQAEVGL